MRKLLKIFVLSALLGSASAALAAGPYLGAQVDVFSGNVIYTF